MNNLKFTFIAFLISFLVMGCTSKSKKEQYINTVITHKKTNLKQEIPACQLLFNKKPLAQQKIDNCLDELKETSISPFIDKLLMHKPKVSRVTLSRLTNTLTNYDVYTKYIGALKKLIKAGASTENVNVPYIWHGNDFSCDSVMVILKNNIHFYKDKHALQSKPKGVIPDHSSKKRIADLFLLANTADGKSICSNEIKFLAQYNPKLLDNKEFTPLDAYLADRFHPQWNIVIAKTLMTKENTNRKLSTFFPGSAPSSSGISKWDVILLNEIIKKRGKPLSLKEKEWLKVEQPHLFRAVMN